MKATGGDAGMVSLATYPVKESQVNAGRFEAGVGEALGLGVATAPGTSPVGLRFRFATTRRLTTIAAINAAAIPAIQNGPLRSGTSASEDRTRSPSAPLGEPAISSNT